MLFLFIFAVYIFFKLESNFVQDPEREYSTSKNVVLLLRVMHHARRYLEQNKYSRRKCCSYLFSQSTYLFWFKSNFVQEPERENSTSKNPVLLLRVMHHARRYLKQNKYSQRKCCSYLFSQSTNLFWLQSNFVQDPERENSTSKNPVVLLRVMHHARRYLEQNKYS